MDVSKGGKETFINDVQLRNEPTGMDVTDEGIEKVVIDEPANEVGKVVVPAGTPNETMLSNAFAPILVTLDGIFIVVKEQLINAFTPILNSPFGSVILVKRVHPLNA